MPRTVAASNEKNPTATSEKTPRSTATAEKNPPTTAEKTPPTTADSDARLSSSSPSTLLPASAKPGLQDTPVSQISTDDDAVADGAKPYDPAAVGKKSHDLALARAIRKLKKPSPNAKPILDNTPTSQIQRSWSGASSDSGTSRFCTPTAQVRPSLCQAIHSRNCLFY